MGSTLSVAESAAQRPASTAQFAGAKDRRRRKRAKISAQVRVRFSASSGMSEEICTSIDVSRDGLLFTAARPGYSVGQSVDITFPFSAAADALNKPEPAEIVRVSEQPGNRFTVAVQFAAAKMGATAAPASSTAVPATPRSPETQKSVVLAVEPDSRAAEVMRDVLQPDGYSVVVVSTATEALEILKTTIPVVFVAEVEAKDMSGQDLCLIVKRNERLQHVPVILLTRSAQPADYAASHQLGAVVCMAKPFKPERLLHVVRLVAPPPQQKNTYARTSSSVERAF